MKPRIYKRYLRCSHNHVIDEWWELRVSGRTIEFGTWDSAMYELCRWYEHDWVDAR
jgi:hypothetical protein